MSDRIAGSDNGNISASGERRILRRGPWENASTALIGLGIFMLMQPFAIELYTYSFAVILAGTAAFLVTSHFPE
jgi:hypothetical protein